MKQTDFPQEVIEYAQGYMDNFSCPDRLRFFLKGDKESESEYEEIRKKGCCGFMDYQKYPFLIGGGEYYFGFNYGH